MKIYSWLFISLAMLMASCDPMGFNSTEQDVNLDGVVDTYTLNLQDGRALEVCGLESWTLWAGQTIEAGTLNVSNDADNLYVTYVANEGNTFGTLHLWVGTDLLLLPRSNKPGDSAPVPGQFPYSKDTEGGTEYTFTMAFADLRGWDGCGTSFFVVAHAEVNVSDGNGGTKDETAFGGDQTGSGNRWWYYASYKTQCCVEPPPPAPTQKYGTAFAKGTHVWTTDPKSNPEKLPSLELTKNRWGWVINLTSPGVTKYDIWNGAGLNNTKKGLKVGTATIDYDGSHINISVVYLPGYSFEESHIYAGDLSPETIAPGQYGNTKYYNPFANAANYSFDVADINGDGVWVVIHTIAYGPALIAQ